MSFAFVCAVEEREDEDRTEHGTAIAMVKCTHCGGFAVGGYICDCGHSDVDPGDSLAGHGAGKCAPAEVSS